MTARPGAGRLRARIASAEPADAARDHGRPPPRACIPGAGGSSGRARGSFAARVRAFVDGTRAGATAIAAAAVTVMTVGASALIIDHVWLVDQRDALEAAADAAIIAVTLEMDRQLAADSDISDEDLKEKLYPVAMSTVFENLTYLPDERLMQVAHTLKVEITALDRVQGTIGVTARADLGGTLFSRALPLLGNYEGPKTTVAHASLESVTTPIEVVLAIDVSRSMSGSLENPWGASDPSRLDIVKRAARSLVDIVEPDARNRVAVGVVPWHVNVRLDPAAAGEWARKGWAHYPSRRTYPIPWWCGRNDPHCTVTPVVDTLPNTAPAEWLGCLDSHRLGAGGTGPSQLPDRTAKALFASPDAPDGSPFAQSYFPPRGDSYAGRTYRCRHATEMYLTASTAIFYEAATRPRPGRLRGGPSGASSPEHQPRHHQGCHRHPCANET